MYSGTNLDLAFHALADGTRRSMIHALANGETRNAGELGRQFRSAQPTISKHLKVPAEAGILERKVEGRASISSGCRRKASSKRGDGLRAIKRSGKELSISWIGFWRRARTMIADKSCPEVRPRLAYAPEKVFTAFAKAALVTGWLTPSPEIRLTVLKFDFREAFGKSTIESDLALHIAAAPCILRFRQIARILLSLLQFGQTKIRLVWFKGVREERILLDRSV